MSLLLKRILTFLFTLITGTGDADVEDKKQPVDDIEPIPEDDVVKEPEPVKEPELVFDDTEPVKNVVSDIKQHKLSAAQYYRSEYPKHQIYLHHTASGADPYGVIDYWQSNATRVGTFLVIGGKPTSTNSRWKDGEMVQCYWSGYWAHHLGISLRGNKVPSKYKSTNWNVAINRESLGIEICNWGYLTLENGIFRNYVGGAVDENEVVEYPNGYRGYKYYHRYTNAQMENLYRVLRYLGEKYKIPTKAQKDIFNISEDALEGNPGIFTHTSVRSDKTDCHPQEELIQVLDAL